MSDFPKKNHPIQQDVFLPMTNVIQNYAWGSTRSIGEIFGIANPKDEPQAEVWMGAHPNGCSTVDIQGEAIKLSSLIETDKEAFLGQKAAQRFAELPYLFKVLAAEKALSIQVHPNKQQAEAGFAREEQQGIPLTAANRNYKDPNHKPELVYALTSYRAMNGFRSIEEVLGNFNRLDIKELSPLVEDLNADQTPQGLSQFFSSLLSLQGTTKENALASLLIQASTGSDPLMELIVELAKQYPGDIGLFVPLTLNVITLKPGQAMFLDAETPHAYIHGTALEIMANSDNVLRAGLTPKYIDVDQLVACTVFEHKPFDSLLLEPVSHQELLEYPIPVEDFRFAIIPTSSQRRVQISSAEILMPLDGTLTLSHSNGQHCTIEKGQSVFIPAYARNYTLQCETRVARVFC